ncbi:DUF262 domain-containing protein [Acinetobacter lwoffii]|uniref:DUF262 domain-containing protein n=1 Tax=Acinetobacter lwoffii TaxID=28090 RepID=UPI00129F6506|nr:DUF262 domain-containing protein [Acinetobacter lwoffii]
MTEGIEIKLPERLASLDKELESVRSSFRTQKMSMSIGELCSLFKKEDLILNPNFQRVFRWNKEQQSRLIESILLGIPLPPIFVAQQKNGKWSVVDGLQRLSTIFSIEGLLQADSKDAIKHVLSLKHQILREEGQEIDDEDEFNDIEEEIEEILHTEEPDEEIFKFVGLKKLTKLNGLTWKELSLDHRRTVRRSFFEINIMYLESNTKAQYELFQRLNTGGSSLTPQEVRNCIIIMNDPSIFNRMDDYRLNKNFIKITSLTIKQMQEAYDMELINRFMLALNYSNIKFEKYPHDTKIGDFIDDETIEILESKQLDIDISINLLEKTIDFLYLNLGNNAFKKYNITKNKFTGSFNLSAYEAILVGVAKNLDKLQKLDKEVFIKKVEKIYSEDEYIRASGRGIKVLNRFENLIKFSMEYFSK